MDIQSVWSYLDDALNVAEGKVYYTPVAIFGYIGYRRGFGFELSLPTAIITSQDIVMTALHLTIYSMVLVSLTLALINEVTPDRESGSSTSSNQIVSGPSVFPILLGFVGMLILHGWSLYAIHMTKIYSGTIIGLTLSLFQLLLIVEYGSSSIAVRYFSLCDWLSRVL